MILRRRNPKILLFSLARETFAVFFDEIGAIIDEGNLVPIPFGHPALAGVLDHKTEKPFPVFDLEVFGRGRSRLLRIGQGSVLRFETAEGSIGIWVRKLLGTVNRYEYRPFDSKSSTEERALQMQHCISGVGTSDEGGRFFFFSPEGLSFHLAEAPLTFREGKHF